MTARNPRTNDDRSTDGDRQVVDESADAAADEHDDPNYGGQRTLTTPDEAPIGAFERRDYLKAVGAAGLAGSLAGASGGTAAAQSGWEAEADQRIEEHRTGELEVVVENGDGQAVPDADVDVEMTEHDFTFGTAVTAEFLTNQSEWGEPIHTAEDQQQYQEAVEEHFNAVVFENLHKWYLWEENQSIADEAVDWALERDMDVRGHVCLWGNVGAWAIPPDVVEAMGENWDGGPDEYDGPDPDPQYVEQESLAHVEEIIDYYGDDIVEWEVVNEVIHETAMIEGVEGDGVDPVTAPILGDWYERAQEVADQYDVGIAVNDYNTMVGPYGGTRDDYERQVDYLVNERGVDLDGIGFQCHFSNNEKLSPDQIMENLDRFSEYGAGLRSTEFDMFGGSWTESEQAEFLHQYMKTFFSHPEAEQFLVWNIWDPLHWGDELGEEKDAPFYRDDWSEKPALDEYRSLVFDEWWTSESGTTDAAGAYAASAFYGDYEITVSTDQDETTTTVTHAEEDGSTTVTVTVEGDGNDEACADAAGGSANVDGQTVCDVDGDGLYRDVTGDGSVGQTDVVNFFEVQHRDAWKQPSMFDFSGNGSVGHGDVVSLFEYVATQP